MHRRDDTGVGWIYDHSKYTVVGTPAMPRPFGAWMLTYRTERQDPTSNKHTYSKTVAAVCGSR